METKKTIMIKAEIYNEVFQLIQNVDWVVKYSKVHVVDDVMKNIIRHAKRIIKIVRNNSEIFTTLSVDVAFILSQAQLYFVEGMNKQLTIDYLKINTDELLKDFILR